jgi:hypothetical protein
MLWLHNPNSAFSLLSSKFIVSLATSLISLLFTIGLVLLSGVLLKTRVWMTEEFGEISIFITGLTIIGIYLGGWMTFILVLMKSIPNKGSFTKAIQVLIGILTWPLIQLHQFFYESFLYRKLLLIGTIPFPTVGTKFENEGFTFGMEMGELSLAIIGFYVFVSFVLFMLSAWFIEKKMEM